MKNNVINIKKTIEPGSLRDLGARPSGLAPHCLPIAGKSCQAILTAMGCEGFAISRISTRNAFVVRKSESIYYLFVRPLYTGYRRVAALRFGGIPPEHDVDHIFAKNLAGKFGYSYVLVALVPERVNRLHGFYEQFFQLPAASEDVPGVCFADVRIFDKALGRNSKVRRPDVNLRQGYNLQDRVSFGLTLKQQGIWNLTFGFSRPAPDEFVSRLQPLSTIGRIEAAG